MHKVALRVQLTTVQTLNYAKVHIAMLGAIAIIAVTDQPMEVRYIHVAVVKQKEVTVNVEKCIHLKIQTTLIVNLEAVSAAIGSVLIIVQIHPVALRVQLTTVQTLNYAKVHIAMLGAIAIIAVKDLYLHNRYMAVVVKV